MKPGARRKPRATERALVAEDLHDGSPLFPGVALHLDPDQARAVAADGPEAPRGSRHGLVARQARRGEVVGALREMKGQLFVYLALGPRTVRGAAREQAGEPRHGDTLRGAGPRTLNTACALRRQVSACSWSTFFPFGVRL